jgi:CRISPR-associated protein Csb1
MSGIVTPLTVEELRKAVGTEAALRRRRRLQPVGGQGDKIFPPTYPGEGRNNPPPRHVFERRRLDGREIWCVLVDSVQSQANRLEESLSELISDKSAGIHIPYVVVDFKGKGLQGISEITSLDAPHRVYDAIFRDSLLDGQPFMESETGKGLAKASTHDGTDLLTISPTALLFGAWHSTGQGGGFGAKFARCVVSEIIAVDVPIEEQLDQRTGEIEGVRTAGRRTSSRIDPLGVLRKVEVFKGQDGWDISARGAGKDAKQVRPSEINHGNIMPSVQALGITCDHLEHTFVLSFAALRRLSFGSLKKNTAAHTLLAALGLLAMAEQDAQGYALRSRCDLVCEENKPLQIVHADGTTADTMVDRKAAHTLYTDALKHAKEVGFAFSDGPIRLTPQQKLVEIVRRSQELALEGKGGENGETEEKQ